MKYVLAIDIGASSGRHILGWIENGKLRTEEVFRFENGMEKKNGMLVWNTEKLMENILEGMSRCKRSGKIPESVGIDTWGVDYVLLNKAGEKILDAVAYRDPRTDGMDSDLEKRLSFEEHYNVCGIAKQPFNTVYQLMADHKSGRLNDADLLLFMPCYFTYLLTGKAYNEYTIATTSAMLDARSKKWSHTILDAAGIPEHLMRAPIIMPGTVAGSLTPKVRERVGFDCDVVFPATHDTGSAFAAIPGKSEDSVFISSGTWSLLGMELNSPLTHLSAIRSGFTNEGAWDGKIRFLRNIMGLWMLQSVRNEELKDSSSFEKYTFAELADMAEKEKDYPGIIDVSDNRFLSPANMKKEILDALAERQYVLPRDIAQLSACIVNSLALSYASAIRDLESLTGKIFKCLHIVGGGCLNGTLNRRTSEKARIPVFAGPSEGTALGNLMIQMATEGAVKDMSEAEHLLEASVSVRCF